MKKYLIIIIVILIVAAVLFLPGVIRQRQIAEAVGGLPYQIGLTNTMITQCSVSCNGGCCTGGTLCSTKDSGSCSTYSDVSGMPSGGMGMNALFSNMAIAQSGLKAGGQLIAGGMTMTMMDNGVLASAGGCYGCMAKASNFDKIFAWLDQFVISGFRWK